MSSPHPKFGGGDRPPCPLPLDYARGHSVISWRKRTKIYNSVHQKRTHSSHSLVVWLCLVVKSRQLS